MKAVGLTQGKITLVDDWNFEWLNQFKWCAYRDQKNGRWYAARTIRLPNGERFNQLMHREIMGNPEGLEIDHINRDATLDNREENLRTATTAQNQWNTGLRTDNTSGFKGVRPEGSRWRADIRFNGKRVYLGRFDTAIEAAQAYNEAALIYRKSFSVLNDLGTAAPAAMAA